MATIGFDLGHPEVIAHELAEANRRLATEPEAPASVANLVAEVARAVREADNDERRTAAVDLGLWPAILRAAQRAEHAAQDDDFDGRRRALRISMEQLRFLLARLAEQAPVGEEQPILEVLGWLDGTLAGTALDHRAALVEVDPKTYRTWLSSKSLNEPLAPEQEQRIRAVARVVNQLRHSLTADGMVDWFGHPREDLHGDRPDDVIANPDRFREVLAAASASRSPSAT